MIDIDVATRLRDSGLRWEPRDGDWFVIDTEDLRESPFMLSSMVIERVRGRSGQEIFCFNGTTEWALDSVEQHEAIWIPRADQLLEALGAGFCALRRDGEGRMLVEVRAGEGMREIRAPRAEDSLAGALLVLLREG